MPIGDGLSIGDHTISWANLAQWLTDAHDCVKGLASFENGGVGPGS
jgi:hypothetical protein